MMSKISRRLIIVGIVGHNNIIYKVVRQVGEEVV